MSEPRPPISQARVEQLMSALRQSRAPGVDRDRLLARIEQRVQLGDLPDFAPEVLPSSSLKLMWLSLRTKALLLCCISAGLMTYAFLASRHEESAVVPTAMGPSATRVRERVLVPSVSPLQTHTEPSPVVGSLGRKLVQQDEPSVVQQAPAAARIPTAGPVRARTWSKGAASHPPTNEGARERRDPSTVEQEDTAASESEAQGLTQLRPHDPRDQEEMQRVAYAERLLKSAPTDTLRIVREDNQRFRDGYFQEERRYLEIMALTALGKADDARILARLFLRDYARGPYRARIQRALGL